MKNDELNLSTLAEIFADEDKARDFLESKRWPNGPVCPRCSCTDVYKLTPKPESKSPVRPGVYKCKACRKAKTSCQFTVRIGTIMEESKIPLRKWLTAIHLMTSSKKGVSSHQIARELGIHVESAWFLTHRIREAMRPDGTPELFSGAVEIDEAYVGGRPRKNNKGGSTGSKRGRGTKKTPVVVLVERDGSARSRTVKNVDKKTLHAEARKHVSQRAVILTDEFSSYQGIGKNFDGGHATVNHSQNEYVRWDKESGLPIHTNTAESYFALLKRGHYGTFHHLSEKHLNRYCDEFSFRWNHRKVTDGERMVAAIGGIEGKRLYYSQPIGKTD